MSKCFERSRKLRDEGNWSRGATCNKVVEDSSASEEDNWSREAISNKSIEVEIVDRYDFASLS